MSLGILLQSKESTKNVSSTFRSFFYIGKEVGGVKNDILETISPLKI
jgi:hypothetical protein